MSILIELSNTIQKQLEKEDEFSTVRMVGRQLMGIIGHDEKAAAIVLEDLKGGHTIQKCEAEIEKWAKAHKVGNRGCCPPDMAVEIICKYFGIPSPFDTAAEPQQRPKPKVKAKSKTIILEDFL